MTSRQTQLNANARDQLTYAVKVFGAKYAVRNDRPGKWPVWNYFRTEAGANTFNCNELKGRGTVQPI